MRSIRKGTQFYVDGKRLVYECAASDSTALLYDAIDAEYREVKLGALQYEPQEKNEIPILPAEIGATEQDWCVADARYRTLKIYSEENDGSSGIGELAKQLNVSVSRAYALLQQYKECEGVADFVREKPGVKRGKKLIPDNIEAIIKLGVQTKWKGPGATITAVVKYIDELCFKAGLITPSRGTIAKRLNAVDAAERDRLKYGHKHANDKFQPRVKSNKVDRPLAKTEMDHCILDCIIVDEVTRKPLCRPWATVIVDLDTRVLLGYYLSIDTPNSFSVAQAITHATFPKDDWLESLELDGLNFHGYGKPERILMDNAKEFKAKSLKVASMKNGIQLAYRPPGAPWWGGHIERLFGTLSVGYIHFLPGTTMSNVIAKGDYDSEGHACLTFKEFEIWFARSVEIYHNTVHSSIAMTPHEKWKAAWRDENGKTRHPEILKNRNQFALDFYPESPRKITRQGIELNGLRYWSGVLTPYVGKSVVVKYNPLSLRYIWVNPTNERYLRVPFADITEPDISLNELKSAKRQIKAERGSLTPLRKICKADVFNLIEKNRQLVVAAEAATKASRKTHESRSIYESRAEYIEGLEKTVLGVSDISDDSYDAPTKPFKIELE